MTDVAWQIPLSVQSPTMTTPVQAQAQDAQANLASAQSYDAQKQIKDQQTLAQVYKNNVQSDGTINTAGLYKDMASNNIGYMVPGVQKNQLEAYKTQLEMGNIAAQMKQRGAQAAKDYSTTQANNYTQAATEFNGIIPNLSTTPASSTYTPSSTTAQSGTAQNPGSGTQDQNGNVIPDRNVNAPGSMEPGTNGNRAKILGLMNDQAQRGLYGDPNDPTTMARVKIKESQLPDDSDPAGQHNFVMSAIMGNKTAAEAYKNAQPTIEIAKGSGVPIFKDQITGKAYAQEPDGTVRPVNASDMDTGALVAFARGIPGGLNQDGSVNRNNPDVVAFIKKETHIPPVNVTNVQYNAAKAVTDFSQPLPNPGQEALAQAVKNNDQPLPTYPRNPAAQADYSNLLARVQYLNGGNLPSAGAFSSQKAAVDSFAPNGIYGKSITSINRTAQHLDSLDSMIDGVSNGNTQIINKFGNAFNVQTGSNAVTNFNLMKQVATTEALNAIKGTGNLNQKEQDDLTKSINDASSPSQLHGAIQTVMTALGGQVNAMMPAWKQAGNGKDFADSKMYIGAKNAFSKYGFHSNSDGTFTNDTQQPGATPNPQAPASPQAPANPQAQPATITQNGKTYTLHSDGKYYSGVQ